MSGVPLIYAAQHMFIDLPEGRWLVDTGSPVTFGDCASITWAGRAVRIPRGLGPVTMDQIRPHVHTQFQGLIGMDLLGAQSTCWDGPAGEFRIGDEPVPEAAARVSFESLMGAPVVQACVGGRMLRCIFDTGAQYGYLLDRSVARGARQEEDIHDFNPILGEIHSPTWRIEVDMGGVHFAERFGLLTGLSATALSMAGIQAIIGCSWLPGRRVWFQPDRGVLAVETIV